MVDVKLTDCSPAEFFRWWLENKDKHGLAELMDSNFRYAVRPEEIPYVWEHYDARIEPVLHHAKSKGRVLEVGSGFGTELLYLALQGVEVKGIEVNSEWVNISRKRQKILEEEVGPVPAEVIHVNIMELDGQYDVIWMKETFHHLEPRKDVVAKLADCLAPGGVIIIEEPNAWNPLIQAQYLKIRGFNTIVEKTDPNTGEKYIYGNERLLTPLQLSCLFKHHQIKGSVEYLRLLPTKLAHLKYLTGLARFIEGLTRGSRILLPFYVHYTWTGFKTH